VDESTWLKRLREFSPAELDLRMKSLIQVIVMVLLVWSLYGLSGAGAIKRLPLTKLALVLIASIFLLRGVSFTGLMPMFPENSLMFWLISSGICLFIGGLFALGSWQQWSVLGARNA
jgi:hypothetical protein